MYDGGGIYRYTIAQSRFEPNLAGGCRGGFIQAVAHTTYDSIHVYLLIGSKHQFQQNFSLQL